VGVPSLRSEVFADEANEDQESRDYGERKTPKKQDGRHAVRLLPRFANRSGSRSTLTL
jgi:hypothetical protein